MVSINAPISVFHCSCIVVNSDLLQLVERVNQHGHSRGSCTARRVTRLPFGDQKTTSREHGKLSKAIVQF